VEFDRPGIKTITLKLKRPLTPAPKDAVSADRLRLEISAKSPSSTVRFKPTKYDAQSGPLPLPAATVTTLKIDVEKKSTPLWYKPPDLAAFQITLRVKVDGMLPPDSVVIVVAPPGGSILRLHPKEIHTGEQTVEVYVVAPLRPAPATNQLEFEINPPPNTATIHVTKPAPVKLEIPGPAAPRFVLTQNGATTQLLTRTVPSGTRAIELMAAFELTGPVTRTFAAALRASTTGDIAVPDVPLYQPVSLPVSLGENRSYLFDETDSFAFTVNPQPPGAPVEPFRGEAHVTQQAPFKQHLFFALAVTVAVAVPYLLVRLAFGMRPPQRLVAESSQDGLPTEIVSAEG
jgi:hypothetical protein